MNQFWTTLKSRWQNAMPKFFKWMFTAGITMSGTAVAVQEALVHYNIEPDAWWLVAYKYLIGIGVGMATASKFTQTYNKDGEPVTGESASKSEDGQQSSD